MLGLNRPSRDFWPQSADCQIRFQYICRGFHRQQGVWRMPRKWATPRNKKTDGSGQRENGSSLPETSFSVSLSLLAASSHRPRERKLWNWKIILKSRDALRRNFICRLMRSAHLIYCVVFIRQFIGFFFIEMKRNRRGGKNSSISSFLHEIQNSDNITIIEISSQLDDPFS